MIAMKKKYKILIGVTLLLVSLRLVLPYVVLHYANQKLATMKGYYGHIDDIDLSIYRGAYIIKNFYLNKVDPATKKQTVLLKSRSIDLSLEWGALFHGSIVGELIFDSPELIFTKDITELSDVKEDTKDFRKLLKAFLPIKVNRFEIKNGAIHYIDNTSKPKVDLFLEQTHIMALNLTNVTNIKVEFPSTVTAQASVYEGTLNVDLLLNPLAASPTFDLNAELKNTNLVLLNNFLKAYGNFDVTAGTFSMYTEMTAKEGKFIGYVKPFISNLKVLGPQDRNESFFHKIWEYLVDAVGFVFKNQSKDQLATKITIQGSFNNPQINTLEAVWEVLRNAFIQALMPSIDNEININSVNSVKPEANKTILRNN